MRRELDSDGADVAWQWTAGSNQPSRRIGGSRQPGSIGYPVRPLGDDAGCARRVPAIRPGVRAGHLQRAADHTAARFGHAVAIRSIRLRRQNREARRAHPRYSCRVIPASRFADNPHYVK